MLDICVSFVFLYSFSYFKCFWSTICIGCLMLGLFMIDLRCSWEDLLGGGGVATKKTERYRKFQIWDWFFRFFFWFFSVFSNATANFKFGTGFFGFFWFFSVFSVFFILANFDWFNGFFLSGSCWL